MREPRAAVCTADYPGVSANAYATAVAAPECGGRGRCVYLQQLPCVVYLHGNSGCQRDCCEVLRPLLSANLTVFALDFSGSGLSVRVPAVHL